MFPEGTRGNPGEMRPFKTGGAIFAIKLNVPILPALVFGSHKAWPKGKIFMRPPHSDPLLEFPYILSSLSREILGRKSMKIISDRLPKKWTTELENTIREKGKVFYG
jgi:1-acyl-sn-glycerol-3-phosphate acyltransferase